MAGIEPPLTDSDQPVSMEGKLISKMHKLASLLFLLACSCLAQTNKTYSMVLSPDTPPFKQSGNTTGPLTVGGVLDGVCTVLFYPRGLKFPPQVTKFTIDTGLNEILIGISVPGGNPEACHETVSYAAHGSVVSYSNIANVIVPGVSAGVFFLQYTYFANGTVYNFENWETDYCDGSDNFVDNITVAPC